MSEINQKIQTAYSFLDRYTELLSFTQDLFLEFRMGFSYEDIYIAFRFTRWILRLAAVAVFYFYGITIILPFLFRTGEGKLQDLYTVLQPSFINTWLIYLINFIFSLFIVISLHKLVQYLYHNNIVRILNIDSRFKEFLFWLFNVSIGMILICFIFFILDHSSNFYDILSLLFRFTFFFSILVFGSTIILSAIFPSLVRSLPRSLGYWRAMEREDNKFMLCIVEYLQQNFSTDEISQCRSITLFRLNRHLDRKSGIEYGITILAIIIAIVAILPQMEFDLFMGETSIRSQFFAVIIGVSILYLAWQIVSYLSIYGEGYYVLSLIVNACLLLQSPISPDVAPQQVPKLESEITPPIAVHPKDETVISDQSEAELPASESPKLDSPHNPQSHPG